MKSYLLAAAAVAASLVLPGVAAAGPFADDLGRCLVAKSTPQDQTLLMQWMFAALSTNPSFKAMTTLTDAQRDAYAKEVAGLFQRLVLTDCRAPTIAAVKNEGVESLGSSFQVLGQVAARGLMTSPGTAAEIAKITRYIDAKQFEGLAKDAGVSVPSH